MTTKTKTQPAPVNDKPVHHIQVGGVRVPIWRNDGEDGSYHKAGQPELSYRGKDNEWHTAKAYGLRDLVNLTKAAMLAHSEILKRNREASSHAEAPAEDSADE